MNSCQVVERDARLTSGCTCRRATGNGVVTGSVIGLGYLQLYSRFAAQVSRDPLGRGIEGAEYRRVQREHKVE